MPIIISEKQINWTESDDKIVIILPLKSRVDTKPSILLTTKYIKVSSFPYIWECFLHAAINPENSLTRVGNDQVLFELYKIGRGIWKELSHQEAGCKLYCKAQRHTAFEENQKNLRNVSELKSQRSQEIHQESVRKQMELDNCERKLIENEKLLENQLAAAEIKRKKEELKANTIAQKRNNLQQLLKQLPPTRKSGHITVSFTPRVFPTAARESQELEEKEWLEKQLSASVSLKMNCKDLSPEEQNPEWLQAKAESMLKKEDFKSAVNAYNLAIQMCPNLYSLYTGRSTCHFQLRNFHKTIEDSSKALELLVPLVASNAEARKEAHKLRGMAFYNLKLPVEGLTEIEAALKIDSQDEELKKYAEKLRCTIENVL